MDKLNDIKVVKNDMDWFLSEYPEITTDKIIQGSKQYISNVKDPTFILKLTNFIRRYTNGVYESTLYNYASNTSYTNNLTSVV